MVIGAIKVLHAHGIRVPRDMPVAGFDDIEFAQYVEPALTTIHQPRREIARATMTKMINKLSDSRVPASRAVIERELVVRHSIAQ